MIDIVQHRPNWRAEFQEIAAALRAGTGEMALRVDHIGSTSVPHLRAKDVIDVQVTVEMLDGDVAERLRQLGFIQCPEIDGDHVPPGYSGPASDWSKLFFVQPRGQRRINVHVRQWGRPNQRYALLFRDYLVAHPRAAAAYGELKQRLAGSFVSEDAYADVKDPAVDLIYFAAEEWASHSQWQPHATEHSPIFAMQQPKSFTPEAVLRGYFHAKDENRPHVLEDVFASNAELVIHNQSANIAFPALTQGRPAIAEVLVRSFALSNENVYSFYLGRPLPGVREFTCPWLVGMSERSSGNVRVGCGAYEWEFEPHAPHMANRLIVTIEAMQVLPTTESAGVFAWLRALNYPWSSPESALRGIPGNELLSPIAQFLRRHAAVA